MAFNRMWNYVSGWTPFKSQANPRLNADMDPSLVTAKRDYDSAMESLKPEEAKKTQKLLGSSYESLKQQFSVKQQYKGDAIHSIIDKHLQLLTTTGTPTPQKIDADKTPLVAKASSHAKPTTSPIPGAVDLSKDDINKNLDIFSSAAHTKSPAVEEVAVKHTVSDTGRIKPPQTEEKVMKASGTGLSTTEISSALDAFEASMGTGDQPETKEVIKEAVLKPDKAVVTGYRGNPYYEEELRKAVDDSMDKKETKPTGPSKDTTDGKDKPKPGDGKETMPAEPIQLKPSTTKDGSPVKPPASQQPPAKTGTGLSKEQIAGNLDIFESSFADEIPELGAGTGLDDSEVVHVAKVQDTGRGKTLAEEKVIKAAVSGGGATSLSKDEITSALDAFEAGMGGDDDFGKLTADFTDAPEKIEAKEVTEAILKPDKAVVTGYRGNPYYEEELRKAVDESMDKKETKPTGPSKDATDGKDKPIRFLDGKEVKPAEPMKTADIKEKSTDDKDKKATTDVSKVAAVATPTSSDQKPPQSQTQSETKPTVPVVSETKQQTLEVKPSSEVKPVKEEKPSGESTEKKPKSADVPKEQATKPDEKVDKKPVEHKPEQASKAEEKIDKKPAENKPVSSDSKPTEAPKTNTDKK